MTIRILILLAMLCSWPAMAGWFQQKFPITVNRAYVEERSGEWWIVVDINKNYECGLPEIWRWQSDVDGRRNRQVAFITGKSAATGDGIVYEDKLNLFEDPGTYTIDTIIRYQNCPEGVRTREFKSEQFSIPPS